MSASASPKKVAKSKKPASHPTYQAMIKAAIKASSDKKGTSKAAILKYILQNYKVGDNVKAINAHLRVALKSGVKKGYFTQPKGTGASGSFKLSEAAKKAAPKKVKAKKPKKAAVKKTAAKKTSPKKKVAAKKPKSPKKAKSPKKVKAPKPKKTPAKKPAAKKTKKSPKKAAKK